MRRMRLLMIEDNAARVERVRSWLPADCLLVVAVSAGKAMGILQRDRGYVYGAVMLDHDLGEQAMTEADLSLSGSDLVMTLIGCLSRDAHILVHSMNLSRAPGVARRLHNAGFQVARVPFDTLSREDFLSWLEIAHQDWLEAGDTDA